MNTRTTPTSTPTQTRTQTMAGLFVENKAVASDEADLRATWRALVEERLPRAVQPGWPVRFDHCFARILLDNAVGRPWREVVKPPAWRNTPAPTLAQAIALGEAVLKGDADLSELNANSLRLRGKLRG